MGDYDVVFECSPLYDVLEANDLVDGCEVRSYRPTGVTAAPAISPSPRIRASRPGLVRQMLAMVKDGLLWARARLLNVIEGPQECSFHNRLIDEILQSAVLSEDDRYFINNLQQTHTNGTSPCPPSDDALALGSAPLTKSSAKEKSSPKSAFSLLRLQSIWLEHVASLVQTGGAAALLAACFLLLAVRRLHARRLTAALLTIRKRVNILAGACALVRKSIRHVQEQELLARGYLSLGRATTSRGGDGATLAERVEGSSLLVARQRCPALRMATFKMARQAVLYLRRLVCGLRSRQASESSPLLLAVTCLSSLPLGEYGPSMTADNDLDLVRATDNFSLPAMKAVAGLLELHCSEYARELAMALLLSSGCNAGRVVRLVASLAAADDTEAIESETVQLRRTLDFHCSLTTPGNQAWLSADKAARASGDRRRLAELCSAAHDVSCHAHAAARAAAALDETLLSAAEGEPDLPAGVVVGSGLDTSSAPSCPSAAAAASSQLGNVRQALTSALVCCDHALLLADRLTTAATTEGGDSGVHSTAPSAAAAANDGARANADATVMAAAIGAQPVTDQFFEAYVDGCEQDTAAAADESSDRADRAGRDVGAENFARAHLIYELKSVVGALASEWEAREALAAAVLGGSGGGGGEGCSNASVVGRAPDAARLRELAESTRATVESRDIRKLIADATSAVGSAGSAACAVVEPPVDATAAGTCANSSEAGPSAPSAALDSRAQSSMSRAAGPGQSDGAGESCRAEYSIDASVSSKILDYRRIAAEASSRSLSFGQQLGETTFQDTSDSDDQQSEVELSE